MATKLNMFLKAMVAMAITSTLAFPIWAYAGGTSGGGTGKPMVSFGHENIGAILSSEKVSQILGLNFGIEAITLDHIDDFGYHYKLTANTRMKTVPCAFEVTVWNTDGLLVKDVKVIDAKVISGCSLEEITHVRVPSVLDKYADVFAKFPKGINGTRLYEEYLKVARDLGAQKRKEIREYMRLSEPKFYEVYTANAARMAKVFKAHPEATEDNAMYVLSKVMGFDPNAQGIQMPVIIGLEFAPLFIVDANP
jgi:hypothetical protein